VRYIEPNFPRFIQQNDTHFIDGSLWGLATINAAKLWSRLTATTLIVAVIDTGIQTDHPDLAQNAVLDGYNFLDPQKPPTDDHGQATRSKSDTTISLKSWSIAVSGSIPAFFRALRLPRS
jgi:subtilisin family serine protease